MSANTNNRIEVGNINALEVANLIAFNIFLSLDRGLEICSVVCKVLVVGGELFGEHSSPS